MSVLVGCAHDCNTAKSLNHQDYPQCPLPAPVTPHVSLVDTETHLHIRKTSRTNLRLGIWICLCSLYGFLFPSQPWQKVLTRLLQRPEAQARCWLSLAVLLVTTGRRLWPKQFSHSQPKLLTAATMFAPLSILMHNNFASLSNHSTSTFFQPLGKTAVWLSGINAV